MNTTYFQCCGAPDTVGHADGCPNNPATDVGDDRIDASDAGYNGTERDGSQWD